MVYCTPEARDSLAHVLVALAVSFPDATARASPRFDVRFMWAHEQPLVVSGFLELIQQLRQC